MQLPKDFPRDAEVFHDARAEQASLKVALPSRDVVPTAREYQYIMSRDECRVLSRPKGEIAQLYRGVISQIALLCLRDVLDADPALDSVTFSGYVRATNPGTGRQETPYLISLDVTRAEFETLVLDQVQPDACLRHLHAIVSPHPYELQGIEPIVDFDLKKYSFVEGIDAVAMLDHRPDLMQMGYTEFEHLVRQVFEAMGMQGWTTTQSHDDGVDAVVTSPQVFVGGLSIVQAKRYSNAVGVNHIRELAGAIEEKKASKGVLVTTSWFTPSSERKAREHGRMELIDGERLKYLIQKHVGKDVLIGLPNRPRPR